MTINNSKLARKPYYKRLLKNYFEPQFCTFMDHTYSKVVNFTDMSKKLALLFKVFYQGSTTPHLRIRYDALDFFDLLILELSDPFESVFLSPYIHEILYLKDRLSHQP